MRSCLLYVGTGDGMFVFHASEKKLGLIGRGIEGNAVRGIVVHPHESKIAYVACGLRGWGLYKTEDAGRSWGLVGFQDRWVWDVVIHPNRSADGGRSFVPIGAGLPEDGPADSFSIHPDQPEVLFYGGEVKERRGQLFVSLDAGESWEPRGDELPKIWRLRTGRI